MATSVASDAGRSYAVSLLIIDEAAFIEDKTVITLGSSSVLDIQEYLNDAQQPKAKFKFNQGTFKSITGEIGKKAPENFNLETKTATIGIRGTIISGQVGGNSNIGW